VSTLSKLKALVLDHWAIFFSANFETLSGHRNDDSLYGAECLTFAEFPTYLKVEKPTYCEAAT
jgi:hypothetical protein